MEPCSSIYIFRLVIQFGFFLLFVNQKTVTSHKFGCDREYTLGHGRQLVGDGGVGHAPHFESGGYYIICSPTFFQNPKRNE